MQQDSVQCLPGNRIEWIDFCRVYTAFFVIVRHVHPQQGTVLWFADELTYRGLIFLFFFLSGYFVHPRDGVTGIGRYLDVARFTRLLWAYLLWSMIGVLLLVPLLYYDSIIAGDFSFMSVSAFARWTGLIPFGLHSYSANVPLWFLKNLMILALVSPFLFRMKSKAVAMLILFSLACGEILVTVDKGEHTQYFGISAIPARTYENLMSIGFFCGGIIVRRIFSKEAFEKFVREYAWLPIICALLLFPMVHFFGFQPPCRSSVLVAVSIMMIMSVSVLCERYFPLVFKQIAKYGPAMMFIYVTHYIVLQYLKAVIPMSRTFIVCNLQEVILPVIVVVICLAFYRVLKARFPMFMERFAFVKAEKKR